MERSRPASPSWEVWIRGGVVVYGESSDIAQFLQEAQEAAARLGVKVVYVRTSGSKLWLKEGDGP